MFRETRKYRARVRLTYESLAALLGLDPDHIISVTADSSTESIGVIIDDPDYSYAVAEGNQIPNKSIRFKQIPVAYIEPIEK